MHDPFAMRLRQRVRDLTGERHSLIARRRATSDSRLQRFALYQFHHHHRLARESFHGVHGAYMDDSKPTPRALRARIV